MEHAIQRSQRTLEKHFRACGYTVSNMDCQNKSGFQMMWIHYKVKSPNRTNLLLGMDFAIDRAVMHATANIPTNQVIVNPTIAVKPEAVEVVYYVSNKSNL
jgi:hypothetical protein